MPTTRREFVRSAVLGAALGAGPRLSQTEAETVPTHGWDCLVLGGGLAGVTAAVRLRAKGHRVLLLEGAGRLGGRVNTLRDATRFGPPLEVGAEYIHRQTGSVPLWDEVDRSGLTALTVNKDTGTYVHDRQHGRLVTIAEHQQALSLDLKARFLPLALGVPAHASVRSFLDGLQPADRAMAQMAFSGQLPAAPEAIDYHAYVRDGIFAQLFETYDYRVVQGLDRLVAALADRVPVVLNQNVMRINRGRSGVTVSTLNTYTARTTEYSGRTAICAFSINMVKSGRVVFEPDLPRQRRQALEQVGMGDIGKVIIRFKQQFFPNDMSMLIWPGGNGVRRGPRTWFREYFGDTNAEPVLTAFLMGPDADAVRPYSDEQVLRRLCQDLDRMFPDAPARAWDNIAQATVDGRPLRCYKRYHWLHDPYALGGYSYIKANSGPFPTALVRRRLANPNDTRPLFWAGEAYSIRTQPGSMHGAHLSGVDAAIMVDRYLRKPGLRVPHPLDMVERVRRVGQRAVFKPKKIRKLYSTYY